MKIEIDDFDVFSASDLECYRFSDSRYGAIAQTSMLHEVPLYKTIKIISFDKDGFIEKTIARIFVKLDDDYTWLRFERKPPIRFFNRLFKNYGVEFRTGSVAYDGKEYELKRGTSIKLKMR